MILLQDLYPGEPGYRGTYSTFPSTDLPSPDSGIGEQVRSSSSCKCRPGFTVWQIFVEKEQVGRFRAVFLHVRTSPLRASPAPVLTSAH